MLKIAFMCMLVTNGQEADQCYPEKMLNSGLLDSFDSVNMRFHHHRYILRSKFIKHQRFNTLLLVGVSLGVFRETIWIK